MALKQEIRVFYIGRSFGPTQNDMAHDAHKKAGLAFSGIDLIVSHDGPLLVEINSNMSYPGLQ